MQKSFFGVQLPQFWYPKTYLYRIQELIDESQQKFVSSESIFGYCSQYNYIHLFYILILLNSSNSDELLSTQTNRFLSPTIFSTTFLTPDTLFHNPLEPHLGISIAKFEQIKQNVESLYSSIDYNYGLKIEKYFNSYDKFTTSSPIKKFAQLTLTIQQELKSCLNNPTSFFTAISSPITFHFLICSFLGFQLNLKPYPKPLAQLVKVYQVILMRLFSQSLPSSSTMSFYQSVIESINNNTINNNQTFVPNPPTTEIDVDQQVGVNTIELNITNHEPSDQSFQQHLDQQFESVETIEPIDSVVQSKAIEVEQQDETKFIDEPQLLESDAILEQLQPPTIQVDEQLESSLQLEEPEQSSTTNQTEQLQSPLQIDEPQPPESDQYDVELDLNSTAIQEDERTDPQDPTDEQLQLPTIQQLHSPVQIEEPEQSTTNQTEQQQQLQECETEHQQQLQQLQQEQQQQPNQSQIVQDMSQFLSTFCFPRFGMIQYCNEHRSIDILSPNDTELIRKRILSHTNNNKTAFDVLIEFLTNSLDEIKCGGLNIIKNAKKKVSKNTNKKHNAFANLESDQSDDDSKVSSHDNDNDEDSEQGEDQNNDVQAIKDVQDEDEDNDTQDEDEDNDVQDEDDYDDDDCNDIDTRSTFSDSTIDIIGDSSYCNNPSSEPQGSLELRSLIVQTQIELLRHMDTQSKHHQQQLIQNQQPQQSNCNGNQAQDESIQQTQQLQPQQSEVQSEFQSEQIISSDQQPLSSEQITVYQSLQEPTVLKWVKNEGFNHQCFEHYDYPTIEFLYNLLSQQQVSKERINEFSRAFEHAAEIIETQSNGQLTIQPFGSVVFGCATTTSDIDCRLIPNPQYSRIEANNNRNTCDKRTLTRYQGALPSQWTQQQITPDLYALPILPILNPRSTANFLCNLEKSLHKYHLEQVTCTIKPLSKGQKVKSTISPFSSVQLLSCKLTTTAPFNIDIIPDEDSQTSTNTITNQNQVLLHPSQLTKSSSLTSTYNNITNVLQQPPLELNQSMESIATIQDPYQFSLPIEVDLVNSDDQQLAKTELFRSMLALSPYAYPLLLLVKLWSKARCINDASSGYLNSFSYATMVFFFLQIQGQLPVLHENSYQNPHIIDPNEDVKPRHIEPVQIINDNKCISQQSTSTIDTTTLSTTLDTNGTTIKKLPGLSVHQLPSIIIGTQSPFLYQPYPNLLQLSTIRHPQNDYVPPSIFTSEVERNQISPLIKKHSNSLFPLEWTSPTTGKTMTTYCGSSHFTEYSRFMLPKKETIKKKYERYTLLADCSPFSPDLPHRYKLHNREHIVHILPNNCKLFCENGHKLQPLNASLMVNHATILQLPKQERLALGIQSNTIEELSNESINTRFAIPAFDIPLLPLTNKQLASHTPQEQQYFKQNRNIFSWNYLLQLFADFFYFYGFIWNPDIHGISLRLGHLTWKHEMYHIQKSFNFMEATRLSMLIEDPFDPLRNSAKSVEAPYKQLIMFEFQRAAILMANITTRTSLQSTSAVPIVPIQSVFAPLSAELLALHQSLQHIQIKNTCVIPSVADLGFGSSIYSSQLNYPIDNIALQFMYNCNLMQFIRKDIQQKQDIQHTFQRLIYLFAHKNQKDRSILSPQNVLQGFLSFGIRNAQKFNDIIKSRLEDDVEPIIYQSTHVIDTIVDHITQSTNADLKAIDPMYNELFSIQQ